MTICAVECFVATGASLPAELRRAVAVEIDPRVRLLPHDGRAGGMIVVPVRQQDRANIADRASDLGQSVDRFPLGHQVGGRPIEQRHQHAGDHRAGCVAVAMTVGLDHHVHEVRVVKRGGAAFKRGVVKSPGG